MPQPAWNFAFVSALITMSADESMAARPAPVKDVSRQVEVVVGGRLRETAKGQGELSISLWNKTQTAIAGPIFVVVDETGLPNVQVGSHTEQMENGKPVFELVGVDKQLLPGGMTKSYPLAFHIPDGLSRDEANRLHLATRVFGRQGSPDAAKQSREQQAQEDADFATKGKNYTQADLDRAIDLQKKVSPDLIRKPDVLATAITEDDKGNLALRVYTETRAAGKSLPGSVGGLPVEVAPVPGGFKAGPSLTTVTNINGKITSKRTRDAAASATGGKASPSAKKGLQNDPTAKSGGSAASPNLVTAVNPAQRFDRPVPIGVSTFNGDVGVCAAGTIGVRAKDRSGKLYAISNSHVWGEQGFALVGQNVVQPGPLDSAVLCSIDLATDTIGAVAAFTSYQNIDPASMFFKPGMAINFIDAALMEVANSTDPAGNVVPAVGFATPSDGYGAPSSRILRSNRLGLQVQKYGRTTGYSRGYTSAININAIIAGSTPVDDSDFFRLDEYIGTVNNNGVFGFATLGQPGDSGSLIVTLEDRRPVSLLFAGGVGTNLIDRTLGNQIGPVLDWFNVSIDDGSDAAVHTGGTGDIGLLGNGGIALGNITRKDVDGIIVVDNVGNIIAELLPPELRGRVKPNRPPMVPILP